MENLPLPPTPQLANSGAAGVPIRAGGSAYDTTSVPQYGNTPQALVDDQDDGGLIEYWRILRRRKGTVTLIACLGAVLGFLVTLPQTPVFQAKAVVEIQDINQDFLNMKQVTPETQTYSALTDIQTQIKIIQSETIKDGVIAKLKLASALDLAPPESRVSVWRSALNISPPEKVDARDAMLKATANSMRVRAAGQTRIIEILADSSNNELAASYANAVISEYIEQNMKARWEMSQRTGEWLARQLDDMRIKLERSEDALQRYARQAGLVFMGASGVDGKESQRTNISEDKLRQLQQGLSNATAERVAKQSRYEMATSNPPDGLPDVLSDTALREYQKNLTDLRRQLAEASSTYTSEYPKVKRLQVQVQTVEAALDRERSAILSRIKNEYDEALRRERLLTADYMNQARTVTGEGEKAIQYNILKREVDSNRQLYDSMLQKLKESSIAAALKASNIRVVDQASVPKSPYKPQKALNTVFGLFAGLLVGVIFVVMRERADRTLQAPGDAAHWLNIPELGAIPSAKATSRVRGHYGRNQLSEPPKTSGTTDRVELITHERKPSVIAESFRTVLTSILFSGENGSRPRTIVLSSANASEGKTTVASNLGIALAEIHQRVLLIDADLRKPRLHDLFQVSNDRGLSDALRDLTQEITGIIQETSVPGLFIIPSGPTSSTPANLFFAGHFPALLTQCKKSFDMVLIDTPPMLQMPDARVIGRMADAVVLVMRASHTTRDAAVAAHRRFADDNTKVLGIILNDWDPKSAPNGYYGSYNGYGYRYKYAYYDSSGQGR